MKNAFRKMCVTICGRFCPDEGIVAGYGNRIREKYTAKWGVQIVEMIFQTCSRIGLEISGNNIHAGRIDKEQEYARKAVQKIESYQMNDIYQEDRLILTFETKQCVLNSKIIENLTSRYLFETI